MTKAKTYPVQRTDGRVVNVTIPENDPAEGAVEDLVAVVRDLVVGYDQGGTEVTARFIERCRAILSRIEGK